MSNRYQTSETLLERALRTIPLGSQTFSKSKTQLPYGVSPYFVNRACGSRLWDVDGNEYLDFVNGLACVTLGYQDPDVDDAVRRQMENGVTFSLPHQLEMEVAELLVEMVPCAEKVRFAKNGTDATSGAIRLARAYTGRDHIAVCGYHGWQDWYIGSTTRDLGVPKVVKELTHTFRYNDPDSLSCLLTQYPRKFAAVILEPMNVFFPQDGFLEKVRDFAHAHGAVLIFDETITGFRLSNGGAQQEFGIIPDLATFGKGLANGYPLSAIVGSAELMNVMERIFFSGTFGGETLSLAAAQAVLFKLRREPVVATLKKRGEYLISRVQALISSYQLDSVFKLTGHPSWTFLNFNGSDAYSPWEIKTLFMQEVFARGILMIGTHNLSYAHSEEDIDKLISVYDEVFSLIRKVAGNKTLRDHLKCEPLIPLFQVR